MEDREIEKWQECSEFTERYEYKHFEMPEVVWTKDICITFTSWDGHHQIAESENDPFYLL
jgi:hypothetical protein